MPPPRPDEPVALLGDLHGRHDLLDRFLRLRAAHFPTHRLIVLGDMIDRGPQTAQTLRRLQAEAAAGAVCLMGNHERMMLDFLADPSPATAAWLTHGGLETAHSFGVDATPDSLPRLAERLGEALGPLSQWLQDRPISWRSGDLLCVHAGADPSRPFDQQDPRDMLWGGGRVNKGPRPDGLWVAHGHTVVERAFAHMGEIALDTGAYATDRLSYALIDPDAAATEMLYLGVTP